MKILYIWKLLRISRHIRIRRPFVNHTALAYWTHNFPPSFHPPENAKHREYFPGCFPPFVSITRYCVRAHLTPLHVMSCIVMHLFALYSLFLPPLLSGRLRDRRCCCPDRLRCWRPHFGCRASRQAPPFDHQISPTLLSTACIRVV